MNYSIVQCCREIRPGGGVSGVAFALEDAFKRHGAAASRFTLEEAGLSISAVAKPSTRLRRVWDIVFFSIVGTFKARRRFERQSVMCHNDTVYGRVYINHGLHRAMLDASGKKFRMLLSNPVHIFIWIREKLRYMLDIHDIYVCFSRFDRDLMLRYYPKLEGKIRIIPNGVDTRRFFRNPAKRRAVRQQIGMPEDAFAMIFVGHEFERKGLLLALDALALLDEDVWLVIVGGSDWERQRAQRHVERLRLENRVRFMGVVQRVEDYLNASDCLVMASHFEAWPLVGLEAMACGIPALITPVGGVPEFVQDNLTGFLIRRDPADIAAKVRRIKEDPSLREALKQGTLQTSARYSWDTIAEQYLALFAASTGPNAS